MQLSATQKVMRVRLLMFALSGLCAIACSDLPGEVVGTYRVTMKLEENSCGAGAVNLLDGHRYAVELRSDAKQGYWRVPGQPPLKGDYDPPNFRFENSSIVANEGPDSGPRGCSLHQIDRLTGKLTRPPDAGSEESEDADVEAEPIEDDGDPSDLDAGLDHAAEDEDEDDAGEDDRFALRGEHTFTISAVPGSDCSSALPPRGAFDKLPCTVRYSVSGVNIKPF